MKFRNGTTNLGIVSGFGRLDEAGVLMIHQNSCIELAFHLHLGSSARAPEYDYEPLTVIYQTIPQEDGSLRFDALHVTRMAKHAVPRSFTWSSRRWAVNLDFYPFPAGKIDALREDIVATLSEEHEMPAWLAAAVEDDESLERIVTGRAASKRLRNRLIVTGFLSRDPSGDGPGGSEDGRERRLLLKQPGDQYGIPVSLLMGTPGCKGMLDMATHGERTPVTLLMRPDFTATMDEEADTETVLSVERRLIILEASAVAMSDFQQGYQFSELA